jgi:hypothetical protein
MSSDGGVNVYAKHEWLRASCAAPFLPVGSPMQKRLAMRLIDGANKRRPNFVIRHRKFDGHVNPKGSLDHRQRGTTLATSDCQVTCPDS